ncbi:sulfate adenylyltransferase subunit CysN [Ferrimonas balearica]|uniref:sulfate adenylyltransferase subunit CysN n=1 Tax=Ferrimonas balearica TaxID=44012 RepID=UPI001C967EF3|nr:sulfate adenylyltransferase subunit CysN [Ferrimonas balearica]MBY6105261.1 sulfate adenylyltransferase subunit CysN [Ferrimonas balearica]MBY6225111.1 sulfate adenylyltransferase subunit CysN [Ferrimonas balearica]
MSHSSELIASDIEQYLHQHENKQLLRFLTCGSVDDGKSTLIGRLLHDSKMIFEDQLAAIKNDSKKFNTTDEEFDLALLVDGLQSEREQGITIDVAYRYFSTEKRKFIIADTPGHEQYTRNMATGASNCDLAIVMIDARHGVQVQTRRHSFIVSLLGIKQVIVAINKMDLCDFDETVFNDIKAEYLEFSKNLNIDTIHFVPISALKGDNVVDRSQRSPWYHGETLMEMLESAELAKTQNFEDFRMPVQYVNRPNLDFRGFCGTITSGVVRKGDEVTVQPSGKTSKVKQIVTFEGELEEAFAPMAITLTLEDEIDISRGDVLMHSNNQTEVSDAVEATIVWMAEEPMLPNKQYNFKLASRETAGSVSNIDYRIDVNTLEQQEAVRLNLNEIARCQVQLSQSVAFDAYDKARGTGSFIIIDRLTNNTVGAGMIVAKGSQHAKASNQSISEFELELNALIRKHFPHWDAKDLREFLK